MRSIVGRFWSRLACLRCLQLRKEWFGARTESIAELRSKMAGLKEQVGRIRKQEATIKRLQDEVENIASRFADTER